MGTSNVKSPAGEAIIVFHIAYPLCLLLYFLVGYGIGVSKLQRTADVDGPKRNQSTLIRALLGFILLSYVSDLSRRLQTTVPNQLRLLMLLSSEQPCCCVSYSDSAVGR